MYILVKSTGIRPNFTNALIKPLISGIICGVTAYFSYYFLRDMINIYLATFISICFAGIIYAVFILILKTFDKNDLEILTKNEKIAKILAKFKLMK
ncbi:MAG: polysaccharide biosynthesis C-terminal domain-containing protein, partial [Ruminococcus sp.]